MSAFSPETLSKIFGSCCLVSPDRLVPYEQPERGAPGHTPAVLVPENERQLQSLLEIANREGIKLVLSAGRTGLVEAQRPEGECVLSLERLRSVTALHCADETVLNLETGISPDAAREQLFAQWDAAGRPSLEQATVSLQAGVAVDALNEVLAPLGRMFPMEMGSSASASIGACVANASAGANAVCYGTAAHMAVTASGFWGDASDSGHCQSAAWTQVDENQLAIDSTALPETWGLIGSQGCLGVITRLQLRTFAVPKSREAVLLAVNSMPHAMQCFAEAKKVFGSQVEEFEFLSRSAVELVLRQMGERIRLPFEELPDTPYLILMQIKSVEEDEELAGRLYEFCANELQLDDAHIGYAPLGALKKIRHSVTESSNMEMRARGGGRLSFDTATPVARFGQYLDQLAKDIRGVSPDIQLIDFGHAGVGGAHLHLIGSEAQNVAQHAGALTDLVFDVTQSFGGTFSAEHGVGPKWAEQFLRRMPQARLDALLARKLRHDPRNILSPRSFGLDQLMARKA